MSHRRSPISNILLQSVLSITFVAGTIVRDSAKGCSKSAIGDGSLLMYGSCRAWEWDMGSMSSRPQALQQRLISHASAILDISSKLPRTFQANHVSRQLLRAGTAAAANYGEARGAESRADFVHKLRIVLKELNETAVWIQLILENSMLPAEKITKIIAENEELCRIIAASIKTAGGFERA